MRKIVAGLFVSVDGVIEAPETWTGAYFTPEIGEIVGSLIAADNGNSRFVRCLALSLGQNRLVGNARGPL